VYNKRKREHRNLNDRKRQDTGKKKKTPRSLKIGEENERTSWGWESTMPLLEGKEEMK